MYLDLAQIFMTFNNMLDTTTGHPSSNPKIVEMPRTINPLNPNSNYTVQHRNEFPTSDPLIEIPCVGPVIDIIKLIHI